jgi:hypothetical protein
MIKKLTVAAAVLAFAALPAKAQNTAPRPVEIGVDAAVIIGLGDDSGTEIDIPAQALRVGFPISPRSSLEPRLGLRVLSGNGDTFTIYNLELGWLYHFGSSKYPGAYQRAGAYIRPFVGLVGTSGDGSSTSGIIGGGLGYKIPIIARLSSRFEANFAHAFGDFEGNQLGLLAGLSFFTR